MSAGDQQPSSSVATEDLVRSVVEQSLNAKYADALELKRRGGAAAGLLSKYVREEVYWRSEPPPSGTTPDSYTPIAALHMMAAIASPGSLDDVFYALEERSDDLDDWSTESMASVLASFGGVAFERLKRDAEDGGLDIFVRIVCLRAMAVIVLRDASRREEVVGLL